MQSSKYWEKENRYSQRMWPAISEFFNFQTLNNVKDLTKRYLPKPKVEYVIYELTVSTNEEVDEVLLFNMQMQTIFQSLLGQQERLIVYDPFHESGYWSPHDPESIEALIEFFAIWGLYPDGDYCMCLSENQEIGLLAHPWLNQLWVCGKPLIDAIELNKPVLLGNKISVSA